MNLETFKKIQKQVNDLEKTGLKFDVTIKNDVTWQKDSSLAEFEPTYYNIERLSQLAQLQSIVGKAIPVHSSSNTFGSSVYLKDFKVIDCIRSLPTTVKSDKDLMALRRTHNSIKFFTHNIYGMSAIEPVLISEAPAEDVEDGITYRYIGTKDLCHMCVPHDNPLYVYLDRGFVYAKINNLREKDRIIITNELTAETYLVMLACFLNPAFTKQLENECFINFNKAKLYRIKFEKDLPPQAKVTYDRIKTVVLTDYEKSVNSNMLVKVIKGELPTATFNQIKINKDTANYEGIYITSPGLMDYLYERMIFDDRTDIYNIIGSFINFKIAELESHTFPTPAAGEEDKEQTVEKAFVINGINISLKRTTANTRRTVNGLAINIEELEEVCYRASCFKNQETFDKFVKSVHNMSLKWHDAIGSGLPVKIHDGLTALEYKSSEAPMSCPRIRFMKDDKDIYLITGEGETDRVRVKLNQVIKKIATLNKRTNNKYSVGQGYAPRNAAWARRQLINILKEACTFEVKTPILDDDGKHVTNPEGKKTYNITKNCLLTDQKAEFIGKMAQTYYEKAVQRSKLFLENAVKQTNAKGIEFNGEECWYVEGQMHKYAVSKKTNTVFNFTTGKSICIVEPGHRVEIGFDATAARLMALKHDSVVVKEVGTLQAG